MFTKKDIMVMVILGFIMSCAYIIGGLMCNDILLTIWSLFGMIMFGNILTTESNLELLFTKDEI